MGCTIMTLITTRTVARMLDMTTEAVRYHEREGHILAIKVERSNGQFQRLFLREDIERFMRQRATQRELVAATKESAV